MEKNACAVFVVFSHVLEPSFLSRRSYLVFETFHVSRVTLHGLGQSPPLGVSLRNSTTMSSSSSSPKPARNESSNSAT